MKLTTKPKYVIGIDEAGRGPLAGPVAVGVVLIPTDFAWALIPGVGDSKQVKASNREVIFAWAKVLKKQDQLNWAVSLVSAKIIDNQGIVPAINLGIKRALKKIQPAVLVDNNFAQLVVKLDGGLKAPLEYLNQETIIKGDAKEKVIGLASILAKVTRDRYMVRQGNKTVFETYDFAVHKGYGTKTHRQLIASHGLSAEHRRSFCGKIRFN